MNIVINGGTRGIGREVVHFLAQDIDNRLFVTGRDRKALENLASDFRNIKTFVIDLELFEKYEQKLSGSLHEYFTRVDILINMAGSLIAKDFGETENAEARKMMETNFFGPASMIRLMRPMMLSGAHIVNISSMGGFQGSVKFRGLSYYSASKAALASLTECLANEFSGYGIHVNCLALGAVQTEMLSEAFPGFKAPVDAKEIAGFISDFALKGQRFFNGKILPVAVGNP